MKEPLNTYLYRYGDIMVDEMHDSFWVYRWNPDGASSILAIFRKDGHNEDQQLRARHYAESENDIINSNIKTSGGLLVDPEAGVLTTYHADKVSRENGFQYAEQFVRHLEERGKILSWRE